MERQPSNEPVDEEVRSVPLETEDGEVVVAQENTGADNMAGGGEWPDPKSPPREPARGAVAEDREAIERRRHQETFPKEK